MVVDMQKTAIVVPTYNAGDAWLAWIESMLNQSGLKPQQVWIIDSDSSDQTVSLARQAGFNVHMIHKRDFNHGRTRNLALTLCPDVEYIVYLTQDAILANTTSIADLLSVFKDPLVACAYGRQLPHTGAQPLAVHARLFNYPEKAYIRTAKDIPLYGIKTVFMSNSFAAYRRASMDSMGGFPDDVILGEDMYLAAKAVTAGFAVAYVAKACVYHSHDYTMLQEFRRYFDIGVFHQQQQWLLDTFGSAQGEGKRFVMSELQYLWRSAPLLIPMAMLRTLLKYIGYRLGQRHYYFPNWLIKVFSMHRGYWK